MPTSAPRTASQATQRHAQPVYWDPASIDLSVAPRSVNSIPSKPNESTWKSNYAAFASAIGRGFEMAESEDALRSVLDEIRVLGVAGSYKAIARAAGMSPAHLSGVMNGHKPLTKQTVQRLAEAFPAFAPRLRALVEVAAVQDDPLQPLRQRIARGRSAEVRGPLSQLSQDPATPTAVRVEALALLGELEFEAGDVDSGERHLLHAVRLALNAGDEPKAVAHLDLLALQLGQHEAYDRACEILLEFLAADLNSSVLWRRLGIVRWYDGSLVEAYSDLSMALTLGHTRKSILHNRGQLLAELGRSQEAIDELTEAIDNADHVVHAVYARSGRAFAYACRRQPGDFELAIREFALAEQLTPDNAWLHFFRARCYDKRGNVQRATAGYETALGLRGPPLTRSKREFAETKTRRPERKRMSERPTFVTGFDLYGGLKSNPSTDLVNWLADEYRGRLQTEVLSTRYRLASARIRYIIESLRPRALVMLGHSITTHGLRIEAIARNSDRSTAPDNDGVRGEPTIRTGAPPTYTATIDVKALLRELRAVGIPSTVSQDAGGFVCNHAFFVALDALAQQASNTPCVLIHVPQPNGEIGDRCLRTGARLVVEHVGRCPRKPALN
jgi:pyroglutamyl-peptidase